MGDRLIDRQRITAQVEMLHRITRGGEIDVDKALAERKALADRVDNKRTAYIAWMKKKGWPQAIIDDEVKELDRLVLILREEPFSQQAMQMPDLGF